jgi:hypothetical protein
LLSISLHKEPGKEQEALEAFTTTMEAGEATDEVSARNALWSKSCMSRMLRRIGKISEAKKLENKVRCVQTSISSRVTAERRP